MNNCDCCEEFKGECPCLDSPHCDCDADDQCSSSECECRETDDGEWVIGGGDDGDDDGEDDEEFG